MTEGRTVSADHVSVTVVPNSSPLYSAVKRVFDVSASGIMMILLSPLFLLTALAVWLEDRGPVFFVQERNGLNGEVFQMFKFRSMCVQAPEMRAEMNDLNELDGPAFKLKNDPRVTRVGRFIRRTSIDELPQLLNIFLGSMSVVGPRPLPTYETARLTEEQRQRLLVKPGLLCFWQIRGRNDIGFDEWMRMDFEYINTAGILTDLKIILLAIPAVLSGKGAE